MTSTSSTPEDDIIRKGILDSLAPYVVKQDQMSTMFYQLLRKFLAKTTHEDLVGIIKSVRKFAKDMEGLIPDAYESSGEASPTTNETDNGIPRDSGIGPSPYSRSSGRGEVDLREVPDSGLHESNAASEIPEENQGLSDSDRGYETTMASDQGFDWEELTGAV
jgi:hypothetical protein